MTEPWNRSEGEGPDLPSLLAHRRPSPISVWIDPTSPATGVFLPYLDIDGHANGGRPWRFRGHHEVALRLLPDPADELSSLTARCVLAVRAWAVLRNAGDHLVPLDYDAPWSYLFHLQRDLRRFASGSCSTSWPWPGATVSGSVTGSRSTSTPPRCMSH